MPLRLPPPLHSWNLAPRKAVALQRELASRVILDAGGRSHRWIAGLDAAFADAGRTCVAGVVLWDRESGMVVEQHVVRRPVRFPYVPGLLSFREIPALLHALRRLDRTPDILMCDGQGTAHPRRFGLASHLGVFCDLPSVGCAKSLLVGEHGFLRRRRGSIAALLHKNEPVGAALRTRHGVRPVYVSPGHRIDTGTALDLVLACAVRYRLPEPTRLADRLVADAKAAGSA